MKITTVNVVMFGIGTVLIYSGIKGFDPRDVMKWALGGPKPEKMLGAKANPMGPNSQNPDPGQRFPGDKGLPANPNTNPASFQA